MLQRVSVDFAVECPQMTQHKTQRIDRIQVSPNQQHFVYASSGECFVPLGFNYDHDEYYRLLEDYWHDEWDKVVVDMTAMRDLGANLIRVHLQLGKFLSSATQINEKEFARLDKLLLLASELNLYLDIVGLGCYHKQDIPDWYDSLDSEQRWQVQGFFWRSLAQRYADNPVIFCYDLMNEPVVPGKQRQPGAWLGPEYDGKFFIQFITLDGTKEARVDTARKWIRYLRGEIAQHDPRRLVSVGLVDWSLDRPGITSGFIPSQIVDEVDFLSAHLYPEAGKPLEMVETLQQFCVGKPVLIDETFHLKCPVSDQQDFLAEAKHHAAGFLGFYTDYLPDTLPAEQRTRNQAVKEWVEIFQKFAPQFQAVCDNY